MLELLCCVTAECLLHLVPSQRAWEPTHTQLCRLCTHTRKWHGLWPVRTLHPGCRYRNAEWNPFPVPSLCACRSAVCTDWITPTKASRCQLRPQKTPRNHRSGLASHTIWIDYRIDRLIDGLTDWNSSVGPYLWQKALCFKRNYSPLMHLVFDR